MTVPSLQVPTSPSPAVDARRPESPPAGRRRTPVVRATLYLLSDVLAINLAFVLAWYLRYELTVGGDVEPFDYVGYEVYFPLALLLTAFAVVIFFFGSLYRGQQTTFWANDLFSILGRCCVAVMALFALATMIRYPASSRLTFILVWLLATGLVTLGRLGVQGAIGLFYRRGVGTERVLVVGDNTLGRMVMQGIAAQPHLGFDVVGFVGEDRDGDFGRFRCLGRVDEMARILSERAIDHVIIALPSASHELQLRMLEHCRQAGVGFKVVPDLYEMSLSRIDIETVSGVPLIDLKEVSIEGWNLFLKRALDVAITLAVLVPGSVLLLGIAILVKLDSTGPIIYRQTRVGRGGRPFTLYKFRSMRQGAERELVELRAENEADGPIFKKRHDPRTTRAGRLIRRASLDELPQLFNVLKGDMSLVGPRPPLPSEVECYESWHLKRLQVAPGMTGLWQVSGRSTLSFEEMVVFDLTYIQNWSLSLDLSILMRTIPAVVAGRGAY